MASHPHSQPVPLQNLHPTDRLATRLVRILRQRHASLRHRVFSRLAGDVSCTWTVARSLLVLVATAALLTLLCARADRPTGFVVDSALLRKVREIDDDLLCWQELRPQVFTETSLDMEIGQNVQGTLVYTVPAFRWKPSRSDEEGRDSAWPKRKRKGTRVMDKDSKSAKALSFASEPPPYSHTESQSIVDSRVNQIRSPLSENTDVPDTHTNGHLTGFQENNTPRPKRSAYRRPIRAQRSVSQRSVPAFNLRGEKEPHNRFSHDVKASSQNTSVKETTVGLGRRQEKRGLSVTMKPGGLQDHRKTDQKNHSDHSPTSQPASAKQKPNRSPTSTTNSTSASREESAAENFLTKTSRQLRFQGIPVTSRSWEPLAEDEDNVFVYSAFYDGRADVARSPWESGRRVRVLGVCVREEVNQMPRLRTEVFCHYRWRSNPDLHVVQRGKIVSVQDGLSTRYHAVFIICDLHLCASPDYVGITLARKVLPRSYLPVQYPPPIGQRFRHNVTTCLPVMHSRFSDHLALLQVLEADRRLGTEKFTLYVHSASPEVSAIIRHYVTSGVMEAVEWQPPFPDQERLSDVGQLVAANDCLYRAMYVSRHVLFHGFHELLLPCHHSTWTHLLHQLQQQEETSWWEWWRRTLGGADYGSYTFQHALTPDTWTPPDQPRDITNISEHPRHPRSTQSAMHHPPPPTPLSKDDGVWPENKTAENINVDRKNANIERKLREHRARKQRAGTENGRDGKKGRKLRSRQKIHQQKNSVEIEKINTTQSIQRLKNQKIESEHAGNDRNGDPHSYEQRAQQQKKDEGSSRHSKENPLSGTDADQSDKQPVSSAPLDEESGLWVLNIHHPQKTERDKLSKRLQSENVPSFDAIVKNMTRVHDFWPDNPDRGTEIRLNLLVKPHAVQIMGGHSVQSHVQGYQTKVLPVHMAWVRPYRRVVKRTVRSREEQRIVLPP